MRAFKSAERMGKFYETCFSPENLSFYIHQTTADNGFKLFNQEDYTKCFYESKLWKYMHTSCAQKAVINGVEIRDTSIETILFDSDFPECDEDPIKKKWRTWTGEGL